MRISTMLIFGVSAIAPLTFAHAADPISDPSGLWKSFPAIYKIHSGAVADRTSATATDRVLTVNIDGQAAKEIFDSIGPDSRDTCSGERGDRERARKGILCTYAAKLTNPKDNHYRCWIGVDLRTGDTTPTVSC